MVSVTVNLDGDVMERLAARAASEGTTVPALIAQIVSSDDDGIVLSAEQEQAIVEADTEIDRGEWVSAEDALAQLRARPR
jgi:predicted transcriptional regulator